MLARPSNPIRPETSPSSQPEAGEREVGRDDMFRSAQRHSRRVRRLKFVLPAIGTVLAVVFVGYSWLFKPVAIEITADGSAISDGKLVMSAPKLQGYTSDGRPYSMSATRAVQDVANESLVELEGIAAQLPYDETHSATIDAASGVFDRARNTLDVKSAINITTSDGAVALLQSAMVDIAGGRMATPDPVEITYKGASINADAMSVEDNGTKVIFERRVRVHIERQPDASASQ